MEALQRDPQSRARSMLRRSRLVGRPSCSAAAGSEARRRCSATRSRAAMLSAFLRTAEVAPRAGPRAPLSSNQHRAGHWPLAQRHGVTTAQVAGGLGGLAVHGDASLRNFLGGQAARFVKRTPKPLVQPHRFSHVHSLNCAGLPWAALASAAQAAGTTASSPRIRVPCSRLVRVMLPPSLARFPGKWPGPGRCRCASPAENGLKQPRCQFGVNARPAVTDGERRVVGVAAQVPPVRCLAVRGAPRCAAGCASARAASTHGRARAQPRCGCRNPDRVGRSGGEISAPRCAAPRPAR